MRHIAFIKVLFFFTAIVLLSSCLSIKPGAVKSGAHLFETFFTGEDGTQYFIKPLAFENSKGEILNMDITFRYKTEVKGDATLNISLFGNEVIKELNGVEISNSAGKVALQDFKYLFAERSKRAFESRFSTTAPLANIRSAFDDNQWKITVNKPGGSVEYVATKKTQKSIARLKDAIFVLF